MKAEKKEPSSDNTLTLEQFQETVLQEQLTPLWMGAVGQLREPHTHIEPYLWRWKELRQRVTQSLKLIPLGDQGAERRVLTLRNPGIPVPRMGTTHTLIAAIQVIAGTEVAPSHRHTMAALRFIIEGEGACTVVNGEPESMQPRDLLLTPNAVFGCPDGHWDFRLLEHSRTNPERSSGQPAHHDDGRNEHRAPYPHRPTLSSTLWSPFRIGRLFGRSFSRVSGDVAHLVDMSILR